VIKAAGTTFWSADRRLASTLIREVSASWH